MWHVLDWVLKTGINKIKYLPSSLDSNCGVCHSLHVTFVHHCINLGSEEHHCWWRFIYIKSKIQSYQYENRYFKTTTFCTKIHEFFHTQICIFTILHKWCLFHQFTTIRQNNQLLLRFNTNFMLGIFFNTWSHTFFFNYAKELSVVSHQNPGNEGSRRQKVTHRLIREASHSSSVLQSQMPTIW